MLEKLKEHPGFAIVGAIAAVLGVVTGVLSLTEPEYELVTDGEICGFSEEVQITRPHKWKECPNPNNVTGYEYSETVSKSSGWVGGGKDQNWHCTNVKREKERAVGQSIVWTNQKSSESSKKDWKGHVEYKYKCTIDAKWGPIYAVERWEGCGEAPPVEEPVRTAKTCFDETQRIGWKWKWQ